MHILIAVLGALAAAMFWIYRMRAAADATREITDLASGVLGAARRWNFRRRYEGNPVDSIDDVRLAQGALTVAFAQLGRAPTQEEHHAHLRALQSHLRLDLTEAEELLTMGNWFVNECNGPAPAVTRIGKRLRKLGGDGALDPALLIIQDGTAELSDRQRDALDDLRVIFRR